MDSLYTVQRFMENRGREALVSFLGVINKDDNSEISKAEAASADLRVTGYSLGGTQSINFTYDLNRVGPRIAGFKLKAPVPVTTLFAFDPVEFLKIGPVVILPYKIAKGPVQSNVQEFFNYYQQSPGVSTLVEVDGQGAPTGAVVRIGSSWEGFGARVISGGPMSSDGVPGSVVRIDTDLGSQFEDRDRRFAGDPLALDTDPISIAPGELRWRLYGNDVNHLTAVLYAYRAAREHLG